MDFFKIRQRTLKNGKIEVYPDFKVCRSKDLMVRGGAFYAIWDEKAGMWSTDEYDVQRLVDDELFEYANGLNRSETFVNIKTLSDFSSGMWNSFKTFVSKVANNSSSLDDKVTFQNTAVKRSDYVSKRVPYSLEEGKYDAFKELIETLYEPEERDKLLWAIGSIVAGDSRDIQKFIVLYGSAGTGKSTVLNIVQKLFPGYYTTFEAKALTSSSNTFATEAFKANPLVGIQHDGDLSRIEDNSKLNSIVSHEEMVMNEKYKSSYTAKANCFLFMGTNRPVKITDSKSGLLRRLIDVRPSGKKIPIDHYNNLMSRIDFELGAIAYFCLKRYKELGKNYYNSYTPTDMMLKTDVFYNFVEYYFEELSSTDGITLKRAYDMYKSYCDETSVEFKLPQYKFREELKTYFQNFEDRATVDGNRLRSYYSGFLVSKIFPDEKKETQIPNFLDMSCTKSILDEVLADCPAQYASDSGAPINKWVFVETCLKDLDTSKLHYVQAPKDHIFIDFDLKDESGQKSAALNIEAASKFPPTYAEFSKGGEGIHLHYIYDGDSSELSSIFSEGIEVKIFTGNSSLRRKLTKCNNLPIAHIKDGLPLKGVKMINTAAVKSEVGLRKQIIRNLHKEIHPGTKPSVDFIYKILEDAYSSGLKYDVSDMRQAILVFANNSTNHSDYCVKLVAKMKFKSEEASEPLESKDDRLVFFDIEVYPNLLLVCWKYEGEGRSIVRMFNPTPAEIEELFKYKLVGFNCRRYDNHILYARYLGWDNKAIFDMSQRIISGSNNALLGEAYNVSYTDVYDFSNKKQSLKKFEIELGIHHQELDFPWDQPVPEDKWETVAQYCDNDVIATEKTFKAREADFEARLILAKLSGLTPNDLTSAHAAKIIFEGNKHPQDQFIYTDLSEMFPGYKYDRGKSLYKGIEPGEGGRVYAEPGMYVNVPVLDIASMHPTSIEQLKLFGPYTKNFSDLKALRIAIKHRDFDKARTYFGGAINEYLNEDHADALAYALKIVINSVYGLTSARFESPFKDPRNIDNIVAKRGALFMVDLQEAVEGKGFKVAHIKTDSIKIPNATQEIIDFIIEFGRKYGYEFEYEAVYDRMCLVNDAVYIARYKDTGEWTATGAQFAHPYVFKTLFSKEKIEFEDLCETKSVTSSMYLDMNEKLSDDEHSYRFVGKVGLFCPIKPGCGGGVLYRMKDDKYYAVTGTKGYRWMEAEMVKTLGLEDCIDMEYFRSLADAAKDSISKYGDFEWFVSNDTQVPWTEADNASADLKGVYNND